MGPLDLTPERSDQRSWSLSGGGEIGWARPEGGWARPEGRKIFILTLLYVVGMQFLHDTMGY
jgi:hypothetical protein